MSDHQPHPRPPSLPMPPPPTTLCAGPSPRAVPVFRLHSGGGGGCGGRRGLCVLRHASIPDGTKHRQRGACSPPPLHPSPSPSLWSSTPSPIPCLALPCLALPCRALRASPLFLCLCLTAFLLLICVRALHCHLLALPSLQEPQWHCCYEFDVDSETFLQLRPCFVLDRTPCLPCSLKSPAAPGTATRPALSARIAPPPCRRRHPLPLHVFLSHVFVCLLPLPTLPGMPTAASVAADAAAAAAAAAGYGHMTPARGTNSDRMMDTATRPVIEEEEECVSSHARRAVRPCITHTHTHLPFPHPALPPMLGEAPLIGELLFGVLPCPFVEGSRSLFVVRAHCVWVQGG